MTRQTRTILSLLILLMLLQGVFARRVWSRRDQLDAVKYVTQSVQIFAGLGVSVKKICEMAERSRLGGPKAKTIREWYDWFELHREVPHDTKQRYQKLLRKNGGHWKRSSKWTNREKSALRQLLDRHPEYYLDEFVKGIYLKTGTLFHPSTVWKVLKKKFKYNLKVYSKRAKQQNAARVADYLEAINLLASNVRQFVFVDETHKDRNSARRRRAWGKAGEKLVLDRYFDDPVRYTCIAACDYDGFLPACCDLILRDEISREGAAGTVDRDRFVKYVEEMLCPSLGSFRNGDPRSIVVMDNASTHMDPRVKAAIKACGALLIYLPPYSPELNPIEKMFSIYKARLKRDGLYHGGRGEYESLHAKGLGAVTPEIARAEFRHCKVPFAGREGEEGRRGILNDPAIMSVIAGFIHS